MKKTTTLSIVAIASIAIFLTQKTSCMRPSKWAAICQRAKETSEARATSKRRTSKLRKEKDRHMELWSKAFEISPEAAADFDMAVSKHDLGSSKHSKKKDSHITLWSKAYDTSPKAAIGFDIAVLEHEIQSMERASRGRGGRSRGTRE